MSDQQEKEVYGPTHKVCENNVAVPTIVLAPMGSERQKPALCVQWFGDPQSPLLPNVRLPKDNQFLFSLLADPKDYHFSGNPAKISVIFLGKLKHWPQPNAIQTMINGPGKGNPEAIMVWVLNPQRVMTGGGRPPFPASPLVPVALLGDPNCGVIAPRLYADLAVRDAVMAKFEGRSKT